MDPLIPLEKRLEAIIDKFRTSFDSEIQLSKIAVIGSQNSGKSSVLEGIVGMSFLPRGNNISTRCPIVLTLNNTPDKEYCEFEHKKDTKFRLEHIESEIRRRMNDLTGGGDSVSNDPIRLSVYSQRVPTLTVIDLPGLVKLPTCGQPDDIVERVEKLVLEYIEQPDTFILAVSAGDVDIANSEGINFARRVDPQQERTLGVVTKLDRAGNVEDVLLGKRVRLKLGFIGVINRGQQDLDNGVATNEILAREAQILRDLYGPLADLHGMPFLASRLDQILSTRIRTFIPTVEARFGFKQLKQLGKYNIAMYDRVRMFLDDDFDRTGTFLGQGRYAVVSKVKWGRDDFAALKSYKDIGNSEALNEVVVLRKLQHENVIRLLGIVNEDFHMEPRVLLEYMPSGSLKRYLTEKELSELQLLEISLNIVNGMSHVHDMKIIHRDLATRNILLGHNGACKLADFGFSRVIPEKDWGGVYNYLESEFDHIPLKWSPKESIPPKFLRGQSKKPEAGKPVYSTASDVWAYGVTMFEIFAKGKDPYDPIDFGQEQGQVDVAKAIYMDANPTTFFTPPISDVVVSIMRAIFKSKANDRPSFLEIKRRLDDKINRLASLNVTKAEDFPMPNFTSHETKVNQVLQSGPVEDTVLDTHAKRITERIELKRQASRDTAEDKEQLEMDCEMQSQLNELTISSSEMEDAKDFLDRTPQRVEDDSIIVDNIDPSICNSQFGEDFRIAEEIVEKYGKNNLRLCEVKRISDEAKPSLKGGIKIKMKLRKRIGRSVETNFRLKRTKSRMIKEMIRSGNYEGSVKDSVLTFVGTRTPKSLETKDPKPYLPTVSPSLGLEIVAKLSDGLI